MENRQGNILSYPSNISGGHMLDQFEQNVATSMPPYDWLMFYRQSITLQVRIGCVAFTAALDEIESLIKEIHK